MNMNQYPYILNININQKEKLKHFNGKTFNNLIVFYCTLLTRVQLIFANCFKLILWVVLITLNTKISDYDFHI